MITDCFSYNGEKDILDIRLNILKDFVDEFVIVEAAKTFSGHSKPLYFLEVQDKYKDLPIKYYVVEEGDVNLEKQAYLSPNTQGADHWKREFYQKESIKKALTHLHDEDTVFISDCDEIWNPQTLTLLKDGVYKLHQKMYVYGLDNRSSEDWYGTVVTKYKNIKDACLNHLRTRGFEKIENDGWHFSSMGGLSEVRRKLNDSYTPESYNTAEVQERLAERFGKSDYMGRNFTFWAEDPNLPINTQNYEALYCHPRV